LSDLLAGFALVAVVLTIAGLTSGFVERAPLSFPIIFLGLGFLLGGLDLLHFGPESALLETVATLTLAMVLCLEAVRIGNIGMGGAGFVPILSLGPGTVVIVAVIAVSSYLLLDISAIGALLLGTILASTDPVVLRDVVREERIPASVRQALNIEAGTNDIVVLPTLLILIALANDEASGVGGWTLLVVKVLVLGPVIGFAIGAGAAWLMSRADRRYAVNEVYQSLYGVGIVLLAYATATALGGDGFLAAFAAGFAIAVLNFDLCQCFLDYGETTSEMAMLLSFILFGVVISDLFAEVPILTTLVLSAVVIFIARPLAIGLVLRKAAVSNAARAFIGWFGPRGLNSLLLALLVVEAGVSGSEFLLGIVGVVVTVSVVVHGVSASPLSHRYGEAVMREAHEEERDDAAGIFEGAAIESIRISARQLSEMLEDENSPIVLDVRIRSQYE
jgi:sodium/hydrogen antiporter